MLLTITTTYKPATDIGYLLHKSPDKLHTFALSFGKAHVFYPEANAARCTAALLLDIDPVGLVRKDKSNTFALQQYVNDRPYVASSFMSVAINRVFGTLLSGKSKQRQELVDKPLPLKAQVSVLACRGGAAFLHALFEPLGYKVAAKGYALDGKNKQWGDSPYFTVTLRQTCTLKELLIHLYVLIPVLDNHKHYFIGDDEVEKLLQKGAGWLQTHPEREAIAQRYLKNHRALTRRALDCLREDDPAPEQDSDELAGADAAEQQLEQSLAPEKEQGLHQRRLEAVSAVLQQHRTRSVLDLGCGEGRLLRLLQKQKSIERLAGCDVSLQALQIARQRLKLDRPGLKHSQSVELFQAALTYRDKRFAAYDALTLVEVVEHIDPPRLSALEHVVFASAQPRIVVVTTPNAEYNALFETLPAGELRHSDHRFEWTREQFETWAGAVAERNDYSVSIRPLGNIDERYGAPTQMAIFVKPEREQKAAA